MKVNDLTGKLISVSTQSDTLAIKEVKFIKIKDRLFITGIIPKESTNNNWAEGNKCAVAWDTVTDFIVFETEEEYIEKIRESY